MRNSFKRFSLGVRAAACMAAAAVSATPMMAQASGVQALNAVNSQLRSLISTMALVVEVALALGALVTLIMVIFNMFKGEREAASKLGWWVAGFAIGFVLIEVVKNVVGG